MLEKKVLEVIKKNQLIEAGEKVVIGVSGGPDSVCLLHILHQLAEELDIKLFAVHINHMLRGKEADRDEQYVSELCKSLQIPLQVKTIDIRKKAQEEKLSIEEAGRDARYEAFGTVADQLGAMKIAVAHNRNDQVETVFMRLLRGTGPDGLSGMDVKRGRIIRPLLETEREEIESYCREYSLNPRTDSSNLENIYTRNRIRLELLPAIKRLFNFNINDNIYRLSSLVKQDMDFIEDYTAKAYRGCLQKADENEIVLDLAKLKQEHPAIVKRVIRHGVKILKGDLKGLESVHVESVFQMMSDRRVSGSDIHLPGNMRIRLSYGTLRVHYSKDREGIPPFYKDILIPGNTEVEILDSSLEAEVVGREAFDKGSQTRAAQSAMIHYFDYDAVKTGINIRNRRDGDIFRPFGSKGTKKLKEYFIDNKVPRDSRDKIPLIAINNEILWVIGFKTSDKFKVTENTKRVLKLKYGPKL